ncbi:MAG TPA: pyridoxamine 5'-phosphate oxidase family protein [Acholeplasmataceae bacterium]|nr:pyridoxamine 5'-phosphate oxidase family protein [Acholeplasmataceae bacterium]
MSYITHEDREKFAVSGKVGLIASISPEGYPHIAFINTIQALKDDEIIWGEFIHGKSKMYLKDNPKAGFLVLNTEKEWWNGKAIETDIKDTGPEYDLLNSAPLFRYNTYFGIGKVHYMKLTAFSGKQKLPMGKIIKGALQGRLIKPRVNSSGKEIAKGFTVKLMKAIDSLKFISFVDEDGFPVIIPIIQATMKDRGRMIIPLSVYQEELEKIKPDSKVAVYLANLDLTTVLLQGIFKGIKKNLGVSYGIFDLDKVYNSMPPITGYVYPKEELKVVH